MSAVPIDVESRPGARLLLLLPALALLLLFLVVPMFSVFRTSFFPGTSSMGATGFTLSQYARFFSSTLYNSVLLETVAYGIIVSVGCIVLGFPVGYSLARMPPAKRRLRMILIIVPLTLSLVVVVFGWMVLLGRQGLLNNLLLALGLIEAPRQLLFNRAAVLVVLIQQFLPFMILSIMNVVLQIDPVLEHASTSLRATRLTTFRKVVVPLAAPGIVSGFTLVFVMTVSAFVTPRLIGGARTQMLGGLIFDEVLTTMNWPFGAAMSFILLAVGLGVLALVNMLVVRRITRGLHVR
ncbi:ABC transporter permease [Siccirubricoccus sp. KC 17139]|uniref:ABC transporter permease n=1 Tax=Siccirubricoccus soli TaxID=2899147 RepID=A0ABT1DD04_9PROT|nr:ABC transporter permease [Siccirubricoccus soli]MCO6419832.1 ABC transporter permease [Siccirubricoccus soli]MCP2685967.1 ABC transporter permease [Siccirubricoccus soli]